eukprot:351008-Pleurochrysis_carterae.AAC.1
MRRRRCCCFAHGSTTSSAFAAGRSLPTAGTPSSGVRTRAPALAFFFNGLISHPLTSSLSRSSSPALYALALALALASSPLFSHAVPPAAVTLSSPLTLYREARRILALPPHIVFSSACFPPPSPPPPRLPPPRTA